MGQNTICEIFGGTIVPTVAGNLADHFGMTALLWTAAGGSALMFLISNKAGAWR